MAVRSKRLFGPTALGAASAVVYTAPSGETAIVKELSFSNAAALAQNVTLWIGAAVAANIIGGVTVPAGSVLLVPNQFLCLSAGEQLRMQYSGVGGTVAGHGAELEGIAD